MDISFLFCAGRKDHDNFIKKCVDRINHFNSKYKYDIWVYSEDEFKGDNVVWIKEEEPKKVIKAFNDMAIASSGDYKVIIPDDVYFNSPFDPAIEWMENKKDQKFRIATFPTNNRCITPGLGDLCGDKQIDFNIEKHPLCRFPLFHKSALDLLDGVIWNSSFVCTHADNWLGYYMGINGQPVEECPSFVSEHTRTHPGQVDHVKDGGIEVYDGIILRELFRKSITEKLSYNFNLKPW